MGEIKNTIFDSIINDLPSELQAKRGVVFGNCANISSPTDIDSAVIASGQAAAEIVNKILQPLAGISIVDLMLYIGTLNPVNMAGLFAGMEFVGTPFITDVDIQSPTPGEIFQLTSYPPGTDIEVEVLIEGYQNLVSLTADITDESSLALVQDGGTPSLYSGTIELPSEDPGTGSGTLNYTLNVSATFQDPNDSETQVIKSLTRNFSVAYDIQGGGGG